MTEKKIIVSVKQLDIRFPAKRTDELIAVNDLSFDLEKGKVLAIVGESGSGKSLTALALMGLLPSGAHVAGEITLEHLPLSEKLAASDWQRIRGSKMGMIFQEPMTSLNPVMKIGKQLQETIRIHQKITVKEAKAKVVDWLEKVHIPQPQKTVDKYPHELSGGQKQRVMIAMAMCNHPMLLIADEPTTALDVTVQKEVVVLMKELQELTGTAMIFITHDLALASTIADDVLVMYKGRMVEYGKTARVFHQPQHPYTQALIACKPSEKDKGYYLPVVADLLENNTRQRAFENNIITNQTLLHVNGLNVWFTEHTDWMGRATAHFKAVNKVSFELKKGEVLGLVGESGCGKSTLSKSLMGLLPVNEGEIIFKGKDIAHYKAAQRRKLSKEIQMIFQDPYSSLNPRLSIGELLMEPMRVHGIVNRSGLKKEALRLLDVVQLPGDSFSRYPHQFSGGQRQRIGIARALSLRPELLICDESVSALDVSVQAQILNLLKELQQELALTYLFISHDLNVVHYISDRVMVMQSGEIVEQGNAVQVLKHPVNDYTKRLIAAIPEMN